MISLLRGKVIEKSANQLVVMVGGVGFTVLAPAGTIDKAPGPGEEITLHTYMLVRQDVIQLYGFDSARSRDLFVKLTGVSGLGPAKALSVLSVFSPRGFEEVVHREDADALTMIPGIGKKGAQRLVLEMKDKIEAPPEEMTAFPADRRQALGEAAEALVALGYSRAEAFDALKRYPVEEAGAGVEQILQFALKNMRGAP